jgi:DNA replication protein DnaC
LFLYGPPGAGKTRAALWMLDMVQPGIFATVDKTTELVLAGRASDAWWKAAANAELAVLDELGERSANLDFVYTGIKRFLDLRDELPAIYISNLDPESLAAHLDHRIASRALCGTRFLLDGIDRRFET